MRRALLAAIAAALLLLVVALHRPTGPQLAPTPDIRQLVELARADPQLWNLMLLFANESGAELALKPPPKPVPTSLTVEVKPNKTTAGSLVTVSGALTTSGGPLVNKTIAVYVDNRLAAFATTDSRGRFKADIRIAIYKPRAEIRVAYKPLPGEPYTGSNATAAVEVLYNETSLHLSAPRQVKWGDVLTIYIRQDPPIQRAVRISVGGETYTVVARGEAAVNISTAVLTPGTQQITAYAEGRGPYAPATATAAVDIVAETPQVRLEAPPMLIAGLPAEIRYSVIPNVTAVLYLAGKSYNGYVPLDVATGFYNLVLRTAQAPPYRGASASQRVFIVNAANFMPLAAAIAVAFILVKRTRGGEVEEVYREVRGASPQSVVPSVQAEEALRLLARAFYILGERSGIKYSRKHTYREYAAEVAQHAKNQACLWHVVTLAERAVYSPYTPTPAELAEGWRCLEQL
jgi:hypothetical protein